MSEVYSVEAMRAELDRLVAQVKAAEVKISPLRQRYDQLSQSSRKELEGLAAQFLALEKPLGPVKKKISLLARALAGGR